MGFYKVLPSSVRYHGQDTLIYQSSQDLQVGAVVVVPLQKQDVLGIVLAKDKRPSFATKTVARLVSKEPLPAESMRLLLWIRDYYPASLGAITSQFLPAGLLKLPRQQKGVSNTFSKTTPKLPVLTKEQQNVVKTIEADAKSQASWLIHGETGSGKTRVYIELAKQALDSGKSVLVLTPEIGLVPPLAETFNKLGVPVSIFHSNLGPAARRNTWTDILMRKSPQVVIGPRSALFSPLGNIGLIVIDEAHEPAYKQEQAPYYHATRVAAKLAQLHKAKLISGTATPLVADYYFAETKKIPVLRMKELAIKTRHPKPEVTVVSLRDRSMFTRHPYLSDAMLGGIHSALNSHEQSLVFINRRGSARLVVCQACGWQATCPNCNLPLTYHHDSHLLRCHTCGYKQPAPTKCPICASTDIVFKSAGTKAIVEALGKLFPDASIQRFDTDNTASEKLEKHHETISKGNVDILVGTQMLGKGLDLPNLSFIGVVNADTSLQFPDFTSEERTYQLLYQIMGRVGRGHKPGKAVIQTFQPDNQALVSAINKDWHRFYEKEIKQRRQFGFPPFYHLLQLSVARKNSSSAQSAANDLKLRLQSENIKVEIVGPSPAFYERQRGNYHWQLLIKAKDRSELLKVINGLPANWTYNIDPVNLL
jgi:primosomal protein N' (replication factor Y)